MLPLAGCVQGQAEFASLDGSKLSKAKLVQAQGFCKMRMSDQIDRQMVMYGMPNTGALVDDAKACFNSQGVQITGFRHKDGSLHQNPFGSDPRSKRFPSAPKVAAR